MTLAIFVILDDDNIDQVLGNILQVKESEAPNLKTFLDQRSKKTQVAMF